MNMADFEKKVQLKAFLFIPLLLKTDLTIGMKKMVVIFMINLYFASNSYR